MCLKYWGLKLTKWWKSELMLATNFGSLCQKVTKVGSQNFGYQIWFCTRLLNEIANILQLTISVRKNFEGQAALRTCKNIKIPGPASQSCQLHVSTVLTNLITTNYYLSSRTCKCFMCQSTPYIASLGRRTCKFRGVWTIHAFLWKNFSFILMWN